MPGCSCVAFLDFSSCILIGIHLWVFYASELINPKYPLKAVSIVI